MRPPSQQHPLHLSPSCRSPTQEEAEAASTTTSPLLLPLASRCLTVPSHSCSRPRSRHRPRSSRRRRRRRGEGRRCTPSPTLLPTVAPPVASLPVACADRQRARLRPRARAAPARGRAGPPHPRRRGVARPARVVSVAARYDGSGGPAGSGPCWSARQDHNRGITGECTAATGAPCAPPPCPARPLRPHPRCSRPLLRTARSPSMLPTRSASWSARCTRRAPRPMRAGAGRRGCTQMEVSSSWVP